MLGKPNLRSSSRDFSTQTPEGIQKSDRGFGVLEIRAQGLRILGVIVGLDRRSTLSILPELWVGLWIGFWGVRAESVP